MSEENNKRLHDYDSAWKNILNYMQKEIIELIFPEIYAHIDWSIKVESLEQELLGKKKDSFDKTNSYNMYTDKLLKVYLKNGEATVLYIHLEIQSSYRTDEIFAKRMYMYYYRIVEKYRIRYNDSAKVVAAAIYTYAGSLGKENTYIEYIPYTNTKTYQYWFRTIDIESFDYNSLSNTNPLKMVFRIAKEHLNTLKFDDYSLMKSKIKLAKELNNYSGLNSNIVKALIDFLDYLFLFIDNNVQKEFKAKVSKSGGVYTTMTIEEVRREHYKAEGRAEGRAEGKIEGKLEVAKNLKAKGMLSDNEIAEVTGLDESEIEKL